MGEPRSASCAVCGQDGVSRFEYRTLNGNYARREPLCSLCVAMLGGTGSVVAIAPADEGPDGGVPTAD